MTKTTLAGSASLHLRLGDFSVFFTALAVTFRPIVAFALTLATSIVLAEL